MGTHDSQAIRVIDWGVLGYAQALAGQRALHARVVAEQHPPALVLVVHPPVITVTPRAAKAGHLLASEAQLADQGITVAQTDRGGDITYHGPGQLVAYPILPLQPFGLNLSRYMRLLERVVIDTVARFGVAAQPEPGATGVWVGDGPAAAKLCALGVRIRKNTTMHGLALNVSTDLAHFQTIVPCGLHGQAVTSLQQLLGEACPPMAEVKQALASVFDEALAASRAEAR